MNQGAATAEVSSDGKNVICRSADGRVRWARNAPSSEDWQRFARRPVSVDLESEFLHSVIPAARNAWAYYEKRVVLSAYEKMLIKVIPERADRLARKLIEEESRRQS